LASSKIRNASEAADPSAVLRRLLVDENEEEDDDEGAGAKEARRVESIFLL
jgi:hypothetical protein